jgi:hypothetical protein
VGGGGGSSFGPPGTTFVTGARGLSGDCNGTGGPLSGQVTITNSAATEPLGTFHPLDPARLFDTRQTAKVAAGATLAVGVLGQEGVPVAGVEAVVMNVTVTEPDGPGYVTVFPCGQPPPTASNLNYVAGQNVPNLVTVKVGANGQVCFFTFAATHLVADVSGWYAGPGGAVGARYTSVAPGRLVDTRLGTKVDAGAVLQLAVLGQQGIPLTGVSAVTMNVTATEPAAPGFLSVYPCGQAPPTASNVNYVVDQTVPNLVTVKLGANGQVCVFTLARTHVVADISGWYGPDVTADGSRFNPLDPARVLDTRAGIGASNQPILAGATLALTVVGHGGVPTDGVDAVVMNVTVTEPAAPGFLTVHPCGQAPPTASNLNYVTGQNVANLVTVKVGADAQVCIFTFARTHVVADVSGWFGTSGT